MMNERREESKGNVQLSWTLGETVEEVVCESNEVKHQPRKRVNVVSVQLVKESSFLYENRVIHNPKDAAVLFREFLGDVDREYFVVLCLNVKNEPTHLNIAHIGSLNSSIVHPREVLKPAILSNAGSVMVCHNHPSGNPEPSPEDIRVTKRLNDACDLIGIQLLDHIILGENRHVSLKERGEC